MVIGHRVDRENRRSESIDEVQALLPITLVPVHSVENHSFTTTTSALVGGADRKGKATAASEAPEQTPPECRQIGGQTN